MATILAFKHLMPEQTRHTARQVVREIVEDLRKRLENETRQALLGAMRRDRHSPLQVARNLDLRRTVREGLRQYQPELEKIVPERVHFFANQRRFHEWRVIVLVDQSGSMGESVVYASIVAAVFASLAGARHASGLLRYVDRGRQRSAVRSGRDAVWREVWRRHGHRRPCATAPRW